LADPVRTPELWSPVTNMWTPMSDETAIRCYHSIALLLPDGQVFSAGGGEYDVNFDERQNLTNAQLFKPHYFFKGPPTNRLEPAVHGRIWQGVQSHRGYQRLDPKSQLGAARFCHACFQFQSVTYVPDLQAERHDGHGDPSYQMPTKHRLVITCSSC